MDVYTIEYRGSVSTPAGFRNVSFLARAEPISDKRVRVIDVLEIDGDYVDARMSRTGANRRRYDGIAAARREAGKIKNLSSCRMIE